MTLQRRHWLAAWLIALTAHGSLILALWEPADGGAANLGVGGMEISFGMAGGAAGANEVSPPETDAIDPSEVETAEPTEATPVTSAETLPVEAPIETVETAAPPEPEPIEPPTVKAVPIKEPKPRPEPKPRLAKVKPPHKPHRVVSPPTVATPKQVTPKPAPPTVTTVTTETATAPAQPKRLPSVAGSRGKSGAQQSANTGSGTSASSGGLPGTSASYFAQLQAWLEKHKEYPSAARRRRRQGTAILTFTIHRDGTVDDARVSRSSGSPALDREVLAMVDRANPLPPFPSDFDQPQITLSVPVQFRLR